MSITTPEQQEILDELALDGWLTAASILRRYYGHPATPEQKKSLSELLRRSDVVSRHVGDRVEYTYCTF